MKFIITFIFIIFSSLVNANTLHQEHNHNKSSQLTKKAFTCSMHPDVHMHEEGRCPICGMNLTPINDTLHSIESNNENTLEVEEKSFTCSMHPEVHMHEEGQCPICGMNLIPIEKEDLNQKKK